MSREFAIAEFVVHEKVVQTRQTFLGTCEAAIDVQLRLLMQVEVVDIILAG